MITALTSLLIPFVALIGFCCLGLPVAVFGGL